MNEYLNRCPSFLLEYLQTWQVGFFKDTPCWIQFNLSNDDKRGRVSYYFETDEYRGQRLDRNNGKESWVSVDLERLLRHLK